MLSLLQPERQALRYLHPTEQSFTTSSPKILLGDKASVAVAEAIGTVSTSYAKPFSPDSKTFTRFLSLSLSVQHRNHPLPRRGPQSHKKPHRTRRIQELAHPGRRRSSALLCVVGGEARQQRGWRDQRV